MASAGVVRVAISVGAITNTKSLVSKPQHPPRKISPQFTVIVRGSIFASTSAPPGGQNGHNPPANMKPTFVSPAAKKVNWSRLPDRLTEGEVEFSITAWTANARTIAALERQAKRDGYKSVFEYLNVTITAMLLSDEETTLLADDGRIMHKGFGWDGGYPKDV